MIVELTNAEKQRYKKSRPTCELAQHFPGSYKNAYLSKPVDEHVDRRIKGRDLHHIIGSANGARRVDVVTNLVHVCRPVHEWLGAHKYPGMVLCLHEKQRRRELDWEILYKIYGKNTRGFLDTDDPIRCCEEFPWIEALRRELIR